MPATRPLSVLLIRHAESVAPGISGFDEYENRAKAVRQRPHFRKEGEAEPESSDRRLCPKLNSLIQATRSMDRDKAHISRLR